MRALKSKSWAVIFAAIYALVLAQVGWWAVVFTRDADLIAELQTRASVADLGTIQADAWHRKVMFWSESAFFAFVACVGLGLLYRALRAERRSREVQRSFIEIVSHESKTPLTALKLRLEFLRDSAPGTEASTNAVLALEEVRRLSGVLDKTLALNRSERKALQFEPLRLSDVVESVVRRLDPWLKSKNAQVDLVLDSELEVHGDFATLQSSVQSLLENAVQYNPAATRRVSVKLEARGARAVLSVRDDGPGIASADAERVFERFYRGGDKRVAGTGLGLYLAKVIVEAHRGIVRLVPRTAGACFEIDLPRAEAGAV